MESVGEVLVGCGMVVLAWEMVLVGWMLVAIGGTIGGMIVKAWQNRGRRTRSAQ